MAVISSLFMLSAPEYLLNSAMIQALPEYFCSMYIYTITYVSKHVKGNIRKLDF